jgi:hypothetical protein
MVLSYTCPSSDHFLTTWRACPSTLPTQHVVKCRLYMAMAMVVIPANTCTHPTPRPSAELSVKCLLTSRRLSGLKLPYMVILKGASLSGLAFAALTLISASAFLQVSRSFAEPLWILTQCRGCLISSNLLPLP